MKTVLRKEHFIILETIKKLGSVDALSGVKLSEIMQGLRDEGCFLSESFVRKSIRIFAKMEVVNEGFVCIKNAKTYYLDMERYESFKGQALSKYLK